MDTELTLLTEQALSDLAFYIENNPEASEGEIQDTIQEIADNHVPYGNRVALMIAADNLAEIGAREIETFWDVDVSPAYVAQLAILDCFQELLYNEWNGLVSSTRKER